MINMKEGKDKWKPFTLDNFKYMIDDNHKNDDNEDKTTSLAHVWQF